MEMRNRWTVLLIIGLLTIVATTMSSCGANAFSNLTTVTYPYYAFIEDPSSPWASVWDALDATDTIEYSDEFFNEASYGIHPELRAASYALALAGFENQADGYPASGINSKLYTLLSELGFSDPQSWDIASEDSGHSMGTTIAHKKINGIQDLIVVAPRNYNYMTEWLSNFNVGVTGDHAGFSESASFIVDRLNQYIASQNLSNYKIWMVGYSRGGAVVDLVAKTINQNIANYDMSPSDFYVYTFGAPKSSLSDTNFQNIHDIKDGNDLLLGYVFPTQWGFYNTGAYEEIHPADLQISTAVIDTTNITDSSKIAELLSSNDGLTREVGTMNGKAFMDEWLQFATANGLSREYFDSNIKPPLSKLMQAYQLRTIDKQSELLSFITDTNHGMLGMIAGNAFVDLLIGGYTESIEDFPPYKDIVKVLEGTASTSDIDELASYFENYIGQYADYETRFGITPAVTEDEFSVIKDSIPKLIRALGPLIVADAKYTTETYGDNSSLYYAYTLIANAETLVYGHIPESIMSILKGAIPDNINDNPNQQTIPVPNAGAPIQHEESITENTIIPTMVTILAILIPIFLYYKNKTLVHNFCT